MPVYSWKARTRTGQTMKGEMEAEAIGLVHTQLRSKGLFPLMVKAKASSIEIKIPGFGGKVTDKDLVIFTRQFAVMIDAGLPLVQCLEILSKQSENKLLATTVDKIRADVEAGDTFAGALRKHPKVFEDLYVNMVEAGESGGILDTILNRLSSYMEKSMNLKKKIKSAMVYPASIVFIAFVVIVFLLIFVIPVFAKMFEGYGAALPAPTQFLIDLSNLMKKYFPIVIVLLIALVIGYKRFNKTETGKRMIDRVKLKLPVFGMLLRKVAVAKFTRTLGTLVSSGVPIIDGLTITGRTAGNKVIELAVLSTIDSIKEGATISEPLKEENVFPPMVIQMIQVGESTGALDTMLSKIADFYDDEVDNTVAALTSLLEPMIMMFLGIVIGGIMISMYLPIFKMASIVS